MRKMMAIVLAAAGLVGCVSAPDEAPAWFAEREASIEHSYPSLRDVPRTSDANTNDAHWAAVEREMLALSAAVKASPRAQPATATQTPGEFLDEAQAELEKARLAHEPQ